MRNSQPLPIKKALLLFALLLCSIIPIFAQQDIKLTGTVTDSITGIALDGVSVKILNTTKGVTTDSQGRYSIMAPSNATISFSYTGYTPIEKAATSNSLNIKLQPVHGSLGEVVVVGYGSSNKTNLATSTSSVSAKEFKNAVVNTVDQVLQGRASGVEVTTVSGEPGSDAVIRIRGNNSLNGNNQPLYVIDGFPMSPYVEAAGGQYGSSTQNGLFGINPNDIESIEVLKDAAATAIYGSRGANGVILIKTKSGASGNSKLQFVNKTTLGTTSNPYPMMTSPQYAEVINQAFELQGHAAPFTDDSISKLTAGTNWFDAITRTSLMEDATVNVSGGVGKTNYYLSGDYLYNKGNVIGSQNKRATVRANVNSEVNDWYSIKAQLSIVRQKTQRAMSTGLGFPSTDGPIMDALRASPNITTSYTGFNGEGIPGYLDGNYFSNPVKDLLDKTDNLFSDFTVVNFENDFKINKDLQIVVNLGSNHNLSRRQQFFPNTTAEGYTTNGQGVNNSANVYSYNINAYLNYNKNIKDIHQLNLTAGVEYNKSTQELLSTASSGYAIQDYGINNIGSANIQSIGSYKDERVIQSAFLRTNYTYKEKYVINGSIRVDGASPFAENKKYGTFPAIGVAWNLNKESFMKDVQWLTNSKIRISYGEIGSQAISPYSSLAQYGNGFYETGGDVSTVLFPNNLGNANLSWERTKQFNAGIDFSLINDIINVNLDYYDKTTDGLLQSRILPSQSGYGSIIDNYGSIRNRGIEMTLNANIIQNHDFSYNSKLSISHNKNVLLNLGDFTASQYVNINGNLQGGVSGILQPGKEIGLFYGENLIGLVQQGDITDGVPNYPFAGAASDQVPGQWKYEDVNNDGVINASDRVVLGKSSPDFTYGWNNEIQYKNFGLTLFFTGSQGNDILNLTRFYLSDGLLNFSDIFFNQTQDWYNNRWTATNPTNNPRYPGVTKKIPITDINSSMLEDGSYFRLKTATLYYDLPQSKIFKNARVFLTGTNLFTITNYTGFDPEVSSFGQSLLQQGIDFGAYPSIRTYTIGFSTNF